MRRALAGGAIGERLKRRIFTAKERAYCDSRGSRAAESYAARFAAKDAVMRAIGVRTPLGFAWPDIEVVRTSTGKPTVVLHGPMKAKAKSLGAGSVQLSLTHAGNLAVAHAVVERK
jgi:holo-[acyl-carrier protein] synthase